jgi:hypothetical protein
MGLTGWSSKRESSGEAATSPGAVDPSNSSKKLKREGLREEPWFPCYATAQRKEFLKDCGRQQSNRKSAWVRSKG